MPKKFQSDPGCVCDNNWRLIIRDVERLIGFEFRDKDGDLHTFLGVLYAEDDFYYVMWRVRDSYARFLSCVGSLESQGYLPAHRDHRHRD